MAIPVPVSHGICWGRHYENNTSFIEQYCWLECSWGPHLQVLHWRCLSNCSLEKGRYSSVCQLCPVRPSTAEQWGGALKLLLVTGSGSLLTKNSWFGVRNPNGSKKCGEGPAEPPNTRRINCGENSVLGSSPQSPRVPEEFIGPSPRSGEVKWAPTHMLLELYVLVIF